MLSRTGFEKRYKKSKEQLLKDKTICKENRGLFKKFFDKLEYKLKRTNNLRKLDHNAYTTLYCYISRLRNVNKWFRNRPWAKLTKEDIKRVYDALEDGKIKTVTGKPFENIDSTYYNKIFKSLPFQLAGKKEIAQEVIEYVKKNHKEVRFIPEKDFRKVEQAANKPLHRLLLWLAFDIGENINALLQLRKCDFNKEQNPQNKESEYRIHLRPEILKRSRESRAEITNYTETVILLDQILPTVENKESEIFLFDYRNAKKILDRCLSRTDVKCVPKGDKVTWKDLRSSMACDLLKKGWSRDEVNARLGHKPSSSEIDKYINFLALDRHKPKKKIQQYRLEQMQQEIEELQAREKLYQQRTKNLQNTIMEIQKNYDSDFEEMRNILRKEALEFISRQLKS